jgi:hypothetical protein
MNLPPKKSILVSLILELNWYIPEIEYHKFGEIPSKPECSRARGLLGFHQSLNALELVVYYFNNLAKHWFINITIQMMFKRQLIDWLIIDILTSNQQYRSISAIFMTRTSSKFNNTSKKLYIEMKEEILMGQRLLTATEKVWRAEYGRKNYLL